MVCCSILFLAMNTIDATLPLYFKVYEVLIRMLKPSPFCKTSSGLLVDVLAMSMKTRMMKNIAFKSVFKINVSIRKKFP